MKILDISLRNLNSLAGGWNIDLRHPAYEDGIFVITGPTGAGKTTILDAICLALYGSTPRIRVTKSSNEVMSRGAKECMAEVTFQTRRGIFKSAFSQEKTRGRKGALKGGERAIYSTDGSAANDNIEALTGLSFDQFKRAVVLPQGEFAAFLNAKDDERIAILEKITSTEIYGKISTKVYEMYQEAKENLRLVSTEINALDLLSDEDAAALETELKAGQENLTHLDAHIALTEKAIAWLEGVDALRKRLEEQTRAAAAIAGEEAGFATERAKMEQARAAAPLREIYGKIEYIKGDIQKSDQSMQKETRYRENLLATRQTLETAWRKSAENLDRSEKELAAKKPLFAKIRDMDRQIEQAKKEYGAARDEFGAIYKKLAENRAEEADLEKQKLSCLRETGEMEEWLETNAKDGEIELELGAMRNAWGEITKKKDELARAKMALEAAGKALDAARENVALREINLRDKQKLRDNASEQLERTEKELCSLRGGRQTAELLAERDKLKEAKYKIGNVERLEKERSKLIAGEPCPLCGAIHHPYADEGLPVFDSVDEKLKALERRLADISAKEAKLAELRAERENLNNDFMAAEKEALARQVDSQRAEDEKNRAANVVQDINSDLESREQALRQAILPFSNTVPDSLESALELLRIRGETWKSRKGELDKFKTKLQDLAARAKTLADLGAVYNADVQTRKNLLASAEKALAALKLARTEQFGATDPDAEENTLENALKTARKNNAESKSALDDAEKSLAATQGAIQELCAAIERNKSELAPLQEKFLHELASSPFSTEKEFVDAVLDKEQLSSLELRAKDLDARKNAVAGAIEATRLELLKEEEKNITAEPLEGLRAVKEDRENTTARLRERMGFLKAKLEDNNKKLREVRGKEEELKRCEQEETRLRKLAAFIGSKAGISFNRRAQNITFKALVHYANEHLAKLSGRYILVQHPTKAFRLEVKDMEQGLEDRPIETLSGGETFLVSLALALGLSRMASNNTPLDSLFLDEGFGTLDKDSLNMAIEALRNLRNEGKMIGIITHVEELKRFPAIEIVKRGGGRSEIFGAGCHKL